MPDIETVKSKTEQDKLGAEKLTPEEQKLRFIEVTREAECSEDQADFDAALKTIARPQKKSE